MGDKSPKSKQRKQTQKDAANKQAATVARNKQAAHSTQAATPTKGKK